MSIDMVNNVQDAMTVDPLDDALFSFVDNTVAPQYFPLDASQPSLEMWETSYDNDQACAAPFQPFQLEYPGGEVNNDDFINFTPVPAPPTQWWYPDDVGAGWNRPYNKNGDPTSSASSPSITGSPSHLWHGLTPPVRDMANTGTSSAVYIGSSSGMEQQVMRPGTAPSAETSWGDNTVFEPYIASYPSEPTEFQKVKTLTGWTYRQVLETVAFKPRGAPHLWDARIAQLATNLGMPSGTTPEDIVTFVLHVAKAKNELDRVMPLVRALAGASRLVHGETVVPMELRPLVAKMYPDAARMLGFPEYIGIGEVDLNMPVQGHSDEISLASGNDQQASDSPTNPDENKGEHANEAKPARQRRVAEEDLYCRVGFCLQSFEDSNVCAKHRQTHFDPGWRCPGPCRAQPKRGGWFARKETLKRHLDTPTFEDCKEAALKLKVISEATPQESGTGWMDQFCERPERPWECAGFEFTELETVKGWQRDPNFRAPPAKRIQGRHRSK